MADFTYRYGTMAQAVSDLNAIAGRYLTAANTFETDFNAAISGWEGESKESMQKFISGPVMEYIRDTVPKLVEAMASLLEDNARIMQDADRQIAENIPTSLG